MNHDAGPTHGAVPSGPDKRVARNLRARVAEEIKKYAVMTAYLWVLFGLFSLHKTLVLQQINIDYTEQSFAIVNALIMAKVMLVAEDLNLGTRFHDAPLLYSVLYKSFLFSVVLVCFHITERAASALLHGKPVAESITGLGAGDLMGILSVNAIVFIAIIPFFLFREFTRVVGSAEIKQLLFSRGTRKFTLLMRE